VGEVSGFVAVGEKPTAICHVPKGGVRVRNVFSSAPVVWLGGPDVIPGDGYPLEGGAGPEQFTGTRPKDTAAVPAPPGDTEPAVLYGCTEDGEARVAWILAAL